MFDLTKYAHEHRFRIRNINDGHPVPPVRRVARGTTGAAGLVRDDVIACRYGYVGDYGPGKIGWYLASTGTSTRAMTSKVPKLEALGGVVTQEGDYEAAGWAPVDRIDDVLKILGVHRVPLRNPAGFSEGLRRARATQRRRGIGPPKPKSSRIAALRVAEFAHSFA